MKVNGFTRALGEEGQTIFHTLRKKHEIKDDHRLMLLRVVAESWETMLNSKIVISVEGSTIKGSHGLKAHPEIATGKDAKNQMMAALKQLELDDEVVDNPLLSRLNNYA